MYLSISRATGPTHNSTHVFVPHLSVNKTMHACVCVCVYNRPPLCEIYPNYEVVVFQPQTVTPTPLGYVAHGYTFKLDLPPHLFLLFYGSFFYLPIPTASPSVVVRRQCPLLFHLLFTFSLGAVAVHLKPAY